jgi:2,4-dienoyl-CoA reductase-like NADH-dependent reductase (Old Yellow Enzyme family)
MSRLFEPLRLGSLELENRVIVAPMCQYSAIDGNATDWHMIHLGHLALSGAGLLITEVVAVSTEGRITPGCVSLANDENETALKRVREAAAKYSPMPIAMQIGHAGRKASSRAPWQGGKQIKPDEPEGWQALAPSALVHAEGEVPPVELDKAGIEKILADFATAAQRAARAGIDGLEVHGAHGYLIHTFLSPISNQRTDEYGGSRENRMRFALEVFRTVRANFPADKPVWFRTSACDWVEGGWSVEDTIALGLELKKLGCAAMHVSSGGVSYKQKIALAPGYQVPLARKVKEAVGLPTIAVGLITEAEHAEAIVANGDADAVALARAMLYDPRWPWHAAQKLGAEVTAPPQYWRSGPRDQKSRFKNQSFGQR